MKIGLVTDNLPSESIGGGIGTYSVIVAEEIARRGKEVHVFRANSKTPYTTYRMNGVQYHCCPGWISLRRESILAGGMWKAVNSMSPIKAENMALRYYLDKTSRNHPFDLVEFPEFGGWGIAAVRLRAVGRIAVRLHGCSMLCRELAGEARDVTFRGRDTVEVRSVARAMCVTSPSRANWELTQQCWQRAIPNVTIVPNPIDPTLPRSGIEERDRNLVVFTGRLERRKGIHDFAEAIPLIVREAPLTKFKIVGKDISWPDGRMGSTVVKEILARHKINPDTVQLTGPLPRVEALSYVSRAWVAVVPSLYENFPLAVVEAMALGTPLVISDLAALREIARSDAEGLSFPTGNPAGLASKVLQLLRCEQTWAGVQRKGLERVRDFSVDRVVDKLLAAWGLTGAAKW